MNRTPIVRLAVLLSFVASASACTTFGAVNSAEVKPGASLEARFSVSSPPGDGAAWFWSYDCASDCDRVILSPEVSATWGFAIEGDEERAEVGVGASGLVYPYLHGYLQLRDGDRPYGVGAQIGLPVTSWHEHSVFARYDVPLSENTRLLLNPRIFVHTGNSPNERNPGTFAAFVQGVGLEKRSGRVSVIPAISAVVGHTSRTSYGRRTSASTVFLVGSVGVRLNPGGG